MRTLPGTLIQCDRRPKKKEEMDIERERKRGRDRQTHMQDYKKRHGEKMPVYTGYLHRVYNRGEAGDRPFPHGSQQEPTLLTP